jgi:hypothetical protein
MKSTALLLMALLLPSCGFFDSGKGSKGNESALYDPPSVRLIDGHDYRFEEGIVRGRGQRFHSHYSYRRAVIIGELK